MCKAPLPSASSTPLSMMKKSTHPSGPPPPISSSRRRLPGLPRRTTCNFSVLLHPQGSRPSRLLRSTKLSSIKNGQLRFRLPSSSWTKTCAPFRFSSILQSCSFNFFISFIHSSVVSFFLFPLGSSGFETCEYGHSGRFNGGRWRSSRRAAERKWRELILPPMCHRR